MTEDEKLVEAVARALHSADGVKYAVEFGEESEGNQWDYREMARAAIAAVRKADPVLMCTCGSRLYPDLPDVVS